MFFKTPLFEVKIDVQGEGHIRASGYDEDEIIRLMKVANEFVTNMQKLVSPVRNSPPSKP